MGLNDTPSAQRIQIGFFGKRNAGKSSLVNAITSQNIAIVSETKGTTTDPVYKSMELLPLGPVMIVDTPGMDDRGELGLQRVGKTKQVINKTDIAVLVTDATEGLGLEEAELTSIFEDKKIPYLIVYNKADLKERIPASDNPREIWVSARSGYNIQALKEKIAGMLNPAQNDKKLLADLLEPSDLVVLVVPIDEAAPKGRLILPQQQTIREIIDARAIAVICQETEFSEILSSMGKKPKMIITDSQVFESVSQKTPEDIYLTSFSILFSRYKGSLEGAVQGARALENLKNGDKILISEGCTHHRQCSDIGSVKLPAWIREYTGIEPRFFFTSGTEFTEDLSAYRLIVHCGCCMLNEREMKGRVITAADQKVPMTNYGILIAYMKGILDRSLEVFNQK